MPPARLLPFAALWLVSALLAVAQTPAVTIYELDGKDDAVVDRVMRELAAGRGGDTFKDKGAFLMKLKGGDFFDVRREAEPAKCKNCIGFGYVSAIGKTPDGRAPCSECGGRGKLPAEVSLFRVVWNKQVASAALEAQASKEGTPTSTPKPPAHYSALKIGKIKLRARITESGSRNQRIEGWWGWQRYMEHLRTVEIAVTNISPEPRRVRVEFFWIGDTAGRSGGAFAYGLGSKELDPETVSEQKFMANTVAESVRTKSIYGRGQTGTKIQGYVVRTIEEIEGQERITGYHVSMPHLEKYINATPIEIK